LQSGQKYSYIGIGLPPSAVKLRDIVASVAYLTPRPPSLREKGVTLPKAVP
jgi:hypothetical protein